MASQRTAATAVGILSVLFVPSLGLSSTSTSPYKHSNNRHVCLIDSYQAVRGPHFNALFDELWGETGFDTKRVAFIYATNDGKDVDDDMKKHWKQLEEELDFEICEPIVLEPPNPGGQRAVCDDQTALRQRIEALNPSILWIGNHPNAYSLRHTLRVHNIDAIVQDLCGPSTGQACLFVGEGAGALCAGANMAVAALRGDDPKQVPELQYRGLELLGPHRSVSFAKPIQRNPEELQRLQEQLAAAPLYDADEDVTVWTNPEQVYVYSQQSGADTTSLVMNPYQKGAIEQYESSSLPPTPPLSYNDNGNDGSASSVARPCTGEPSEDPSRTIYTAQVEEGDYC